MNPQINELAAVLFAVNCKTKPKQTSRAKKKYTSKRHAVGEQAKFKYSYILTY